jgi:hypothetical protein
MTADERFMNQLQPTKPKLKSQFKYSEAEEFVICECISQSPANLRAAFELAASRLKGRTPRGIGSYYYNHLKHSEKAAFAIVSHHGAAKNVKSMPRKIVKDTPIDLHELALSVIIPKLTPEQKLALVQTLLDSQE